MALTEANKISIAQILGITVAEVSLQEANLGVYLTAGMITAIQAEITRWVTAGINFTAIEPKEKNFGARIDPNAAKADIRRNIAVLLERPDWAQSVSNNQVELIRG